MNTPTRREALAAQFDAAEKETPETQEVAVETPEPVVETKLRAEDGKFVKADTKPITAAKTDKNDPLPEDKYVKPPKSWKQDFHTHYAGLTPEVRAYLHQREDEQLKGVEPLKMRAQRADLIDQALGPVRGELESRGVAVDAFLRDISQTVWTLAKGNPEQKRAVLQNIARTYGVEMAQQAAQASQPGAQQNPELARLHAELGGLKQTFEQQQREREAAEWAQVNNSIAQFENDTVKYPHFAAVRVTMGRLMASQEAKDMETAYSKAVRLHDDIWQQEQAKQSADAEAKRKADQAAAAKAARASAVSPRSASPAGGNADDTGSRKGRRETVAAAVERVMGGGRV